MSAGLLSGRRVALGVTGSIAAYKALAVASRLTQAGTAVDVLLTRSAREFVRPLAFQAITHRPVVASLWEPTGAMALDHISIARGVDALVVAPATADVIARLSLGRADDALTTTALATRAPMLVAPAMEPQMWSHPATQDHVATLARRGVAFVGPEPGRMASGETGVGRMAEPDLVVDHLRLLLARGGPLAGRTVLVTAGPTREPLDPVRFLSNHSTGRMGRALALAARDLGAEVTLVLGPVEWDAPAGVDAIRAGSAQQMCDAVLARAVDVDAVVMTAAVADYRPADPRDRKIKKADGEISLRLARNPDILLALEAHLAHSGGVRPVRVGFAAETDNLLANAEAKRQRKALDLIVANPVPASFGAGQVEATLIDADGATRLAPQDKHAIAEAVIQRVVDLLGAREAALDHPKS